MPLVTDTYGKITASDIAPGANLLETDVQHRRHLHHAVAGGADAAALTIQLGRMAKSGSIVSAYVTPNAVPAGGTKTMTVDLQKSTGGGAWTTVLSSTLTINSSSTARTPVAMSLSGTPTHVAGDVYQLVVTVAGTGGTGVQGWDIDVYATENCT